MRVNPRGSEVGGFLLLLFFRLSWDPKVRKEDEEVDVRRGGDGKSIVSLRMRGELLVARLDSEALLWSS
jgi:hypothetical protein